VDKINVAVQELLTYAANRVNLPI